MLADSLPDRVIVQTQDGRIYENVPASVQRNQITIFRTDIPIRPGDHLMRRIPSGVVEVFSVIDPGFSKGAHAIPDAYQIRVRRVDSPTTGASVIYNITGTNTRFNINSVDSSTNVVNQLPHEVFGALCTVIESQLSVSRDKEELLRLTQSLKEEAGKDTFGRRYAEFMSLAANHMDVLSPFIPALTQMLMSTSIGK